MAESVRDPGGTLVGHGRFAVVADLSNSVATVCNMRSVPVSARLSMTVVAAALLPMSPLFLFKYPIAELVQRLVNKLAGL